jgi:phage repressor protein C with HTH and peptisase S24 domain
MDKTRPIAVQLKEAREEAGIGLREVARRLGMNPATYRHYENPDRFKSEYLPFALAQDIQAKVGHEGFAFKAMELAGVLKGFTNVDEVQHPMIRVENEDAPPSDRDLVPVYAVQASAGPGALISEEYQEYSLAFPPSYLKTFTSSSPKNLSIISVKGESMEPTLVDNDIVLLDMSKTNLSYDGLFVIRFDDALHVKRVGRSPKKGHITIISDNKELYPPMEAAVADIEPVGKVLWYGRKV